MAITFGARPSADRHTSQPETPPSDFPAWLFATARTDKGRFPDWPYVHEYAEALASGRDLIVLKRRQALFSWITAAYTHWLASRNEYAHCAVVSSSLREAQDQAGRIVFVAKYDGYDVRGGERITYPSGSVVSILPATHHAGIGKSLRFAHFDEYADHPYGEDNLAAIGPAVSNSGGQLVITSTSHPGLGEVGPFYRAWTEDTDALRLFYGRYCRPDQGEEFIEAERRRPGYSDDVMSAYYPRTQEEAFSTRTGLVYPGFSRSEHVAPPEVAWKDCRWRVVGYDPGGQDPTGLVAVGVYPALPLRDPGANVRGMWRHHVYGAWRATGPISAFDVREWVGTIGGVHRVYVGETGGSTLAETLRALNLPAWQAPMAKREGVGHVRWLIESGMLTVSPACQQVVEEFGQYWVRPMREGEVTGTTYPTTATEAHHADLLDALRYACLGVMHDLPGEPGRVERARRAG